MNFETTKGSGLIDRCIDRMDSMRPNLRLLQDTLDNLKDEDTGPSDAAVAVLRMLTDELRKDLEQLDLDLNYGCKPTSYGRELNGRGL